MTALALPRPARLALEHWEATFAAGAFLAFCAAVLLRPAALLEPDDLAYQTSGGIPPMGGPSFGP